jgi:hypothetical protein
MKTEFSKEIAIQLIHQYFGEVVAQFYINFYRDITLEHVRISLTEILSEFLGEQKALEIINQYQFLSK